MDVDETKVAVGFVGSLLVLALLVFLVGIEDVANALALLDATTAATLAALGVGWLVAWGLSLRAVLAALGIPVSRTTAILLYASAAFANNITPFGQAGGEPFSGYIISRATDAEYESGLAAIASVDSINLVPSLAFALLGLAYYALQYTVLDRVRDIALVVVALALALPLAVYLGWRFRERVRSGLVGVLTPLFGAVSRVIPGFTAPDRDQIRTHVDGFFRAIGRVASDRRRILVAAAFSAAGWFVMCVALWLSIRGLGHSVPFAIAFVVVPVATIASITPLPGGTGGVEAAIILILVPTTGVSTATAGAAAIVFRAATYWLPTALGGLSVVALESRTAS
ncbi:lysylphosphatidylglycerol synthase transmembrane domain-containing protein [Halobacterium zhouii]|uniref:lysylphosphatidylglycerol synthase transmembrane domain-containing protein n=1 Tax=Halobacterium zhouii TaxID=2902624 RepID=UPI001E47DFD9|nr:lysylphosphatidylglycerol synthase transmembrane domain-containing protein [Halobacterium zhouii]